MKLKNFFNKLHVKHRFECGIKYTYKGTRLLFVIPFDNLAYRQRNIFTALKNAITHEISSFPTLCDVSSFSQGYSLLHIPYSRNRPAKARNIPLVQMMKIFLADISL